LPWRTRKTITFPLDAIEDYILTDRKTSQTATYLVARPANARILRALNNAIDHAVSDIRTPGFRSYVIPDVVQVGISLWAADVRH